MAQTTDTRSSDVRARFPDHTQPPVATLWPPRLHPAVGATGRVLLLLCFALLVGVLAYQAPPGGRVPVGWLGDRLFLDSSAGLGADAEQRGDFYADALTPDSPTGRSRWTRRHARMVLPDLGAGTDLDVRLLVQGWPADVLGVPIEQPEVTLQADGSAIGTFTPTGQWATYTLRVPATLRRGADLTLDLTTSATFSESERYRTDPRPKGIRLAGVEVRAVDGDPMTLLPPAWRAVGTLMGLALLLYLVLLRLFRSVPPVFVLTVISVGVAGTSLAVWRIWTVVALGMLTWGLALALVGVWHQPLQRLSGALARRYGQGRALSYGLLAAALVWPGYVLARWSQAFQLPGLALARQTFPDSLLYGLFGVGLLALTLVLGRKGLPLVASGIVDLVRSRRGALAVLLVLGGVWLGYEALIIRTMAYVGHADYADNAVVARNLVAGRGWVVDYVTQFYRLYEGVTRPQETWPLLQPVWMAPFMAVFGAQAWAAKLPNLLFNVALLLLIYHIGAYLWDRRVGVTAAGFTLTSHLFFKLTIYTTSDLAFVVLALGGMYLLYRAVEDRQPAPVRSGGGRFAAVPALVSRQRVLVGSGVLTGLMMLQKPSGAVIAVGMGLWLLLNVRQAPGGRHAATPGGAGLPAHRRLLAGVWTMIEQRAPLFLVWAIPALLVLSPYIARNLVLFGSPVYSTERYDAWVLGYRGTSEEAWEDIYRVYTPELGGPGVPEANWILRWGFDQSLAKLQTQVEEARNYLMPAWAGAPEGLSLLMSSDARKNVLSPLAAWLALLGGGVALMTRRRLMGLLLLAFGLYTLFLMTYWRTNEWRYFVVMVPWLALLAAWMIWGGFDRIARIGNGVWSPVALLLACTMIVAVVQPSWPHIAEKVQQEPARWEPDLMAYDWIRGNVPPDAVMMTRIPWQLNWHTQRPAVMIPNTGSRETLLGLAGHYDACYLVLENQLRAKGDVEQILAPLMNAEEQQVGDTIDGFTLVYKSPTPGNRALIYRFPQSPADGYRTESCEF